MGFSSSGVYPTNYNNRYIGLSVRAVKQSAVGYYNYTTLYNDATDGQYWSTYLNPTWTNQAAYMYFNSSRVMPEYYIYYRYIGNSVRFIKSLKSVGSYNGSAFHGDTTNGYYWSANIYGATSGSIMSFSSSKVELNIGYGRYCGLSVRFIKSLKSVGSYDGTTLNGDTAGSYYWSADIYPSDTSYAYYMTSWGGGHLRYCGLSVRAVHN